MDRISAVRFIIDDLSLEGKLEDYHEWLLALHDSNPARRRDNKDKEYERYTQKMFYLYVRQFVPNVQFDRIDEEPYFYFVVDRTKRAIQVNIHDDFYRNFIREVSLYNECKPTLK
jgi:hypothetical protein